MVAIHIIIIQQAKFIEMVAGKYCRNVLLQKEIKGSRTWTAHLSIQQISSFAR